MSAGREQCNSTSDPEKKRTSSPREGEKTQSRSLSDEHAALGAAAFTGAAKHKAGFMGFKGSWVHAPKFASR